MVVSLILIVDLKHESDAAGPKLYRKLNYYEKLLYILHERPEHLRYSLLLNDLHQRNNIKDVKQAIAPKFGIILE